VELFETGVGDRGENMALFTTRTLRFLRDAVREAPKTEKG
jgi:hypothetical protein